MTYQFIEWRIDQDAQAAVITLNRPEVRNALSDRLLEEALEAARAADADHAVRSIILTGKGERAFAAGADLNEVLRRDQFGVIGPVFGARRELARLLEQGDKPSIAAINGDAVGGGLELALACTLRVAVPGARLGLGEINLGIMPGNGGTQRLVRLIGLGRAMELILTGDLITAEDGHRIGLVNRVVPPEDLMPTALALARKLADKSALALRAAKESVLLALDLPLEAGLAYENRWYAILNSGQDKQEGVRAFLEKRPPRFGRQPESGLQG